MCKSLNIRNKLKMESKYSLISLKQLDETSPPSSIVNGDHNNVADVIFALLLWCAVIDHVDDILEHLDTVQVSVKTRESVFSKMLLAKEIHII